MSKVCSVREIGDDLEISIPEMNQPNDFNSLINLMEKSFGATRIDKIAGPDAIVFIFQKDGMKFSLSFDDFDGLEIRCRNDGPMTELQRFIPEIETAFEYLAR